MWDARCVCAVLMRRYELLPDADPKGYYWVMKQLVHRRNALVRSVGKDIADDILLEGFDKALVHVATDGTVTIKSLK